MAPMFICEHHSFPSVLSTSDYRTTDSPFGDSGSARSLYRRNPFTPAPVRLEDFFSPDRNDASKELEGQRSPTPYVSFD